MTIAVTPVATHRGETVHEARLTSDSVALSLLSYGAVVRDWKVRDRTGTPRTVTLGFETFEPYPAHSRSFGVVAGRVANRIAEGRFTLDGERHALDRNEGRHHLHGGRAGFGQRLWAMAADGDTLHLTLTSADGDMGYPGRVAVTVDVTLADATVTFDMTAVPDRPTPVALAQHSYYALGGPTAEHVLMVDADRITATDRDNIPTGTLAAVAGTPLDFRTPRRVGDVPIDNNFCLNGRDRPAVAGAPAVTLEGEAMRLSLTTDRPGVQVYNAANMPPIPVPGLDGVRYGPFAGIALEAQDWPDAVNHPTFPSVIATPERPYRQTTRITITPR
ncbi:aldose epimerase family protein [Acuticoccus mangrovi]|uniref:Aldose 1-epimerase n=1 Tax=Acuticoccus mangrovi TaxID=2796142 RepID=A0A934ISN9_9HYPH|nr:galactose mutarotase [Acuticoccus mangrovi]